MMKITTTEPKIVSNTKRQQQQNEAINALTSVVRKESEVLFDKNFEAEKELIYCNYKLGQLVGTILTPKFNSRSKPPAKLIQDLSVSLGKKRIALYRNYNITLLYSWEYILNMLKKAYESKTLFSWSHLVALAQVKDDANVRKELEDALISKKYGITRLYAAIRTATGEKIRRKVKNDALTIDEELISDLEENLKKLDSYFFSFRMSIGKPKVKNTLETAISDGDAGILTHCAEKSIKKIKRLCKTIGFRLTELSTMLNKISLGKRSVKTMKNIDNMSKKLSKLINGDSNDK